MAKSSFNSALLTFVFLAIVGLTVFSIYQYTLITDIDTQKLGIEETSSDKSVVVRKETENTPSFVFSDCTDCEKVVQSMIDKSKESEPVSVAKQIVVTQPKTQTSYVPLGTTASSTSIDWYTITNASVYIDLANDFSDGAYVTWGISLKVAHGNGQAFARLWDDTNKIAVNGSEITTVGNEEYKTMKSGQLFLWNGNNNYKIQLKSLNGFEITASDAKVKLVY